MTRAQKKANEENNFAQQAEVKIRRIIRLEQILIRAQRIVTRRVTIGTSVAPPPQRSQQVQRDDRPSRPLPNLVPLKSILKMPMWVKLHLFQCT